MAGLVVQSACGRTSAARLSPDGWIRLAFGDESLELGDREPDALADSDRVELVGPDQVVDRGPSEREEPCGFGDGDEERGLPNH